MRLEARLPGAVYVLQAGIVLNAFGNGAAGPFILLYLHDVRGIPLPAAGAATATNAACALLASLAGGTVADRVGPRVTVLTGLLIAAFTFLAYPLVHTAWQAVLAGAALGIAGGGWLTGQSVLLAAIVPPDRRHIAFAQQRVAANVGLGLGGLVGGLIVSTSTASTFTTLFVLNAASFIAYGGFVAAVRVPQRPARPNRQVGYGRLIRDGALLRVLAVDVAVVGGAIALLNGLMPVYARNQVGVSESAIGALFLVNSLLIIGAQLPFARAVEGHRRSRALALMASLFALCWLFVLGASAGGYLLLLAGVAILSAGECIYDSVRTPLIADLAPDGLTGRYLASAGFSWQLGFIVGPLIGATLLAVEPPSLWIVASLICFVAAVAALRLDLRLPEHARVTARRSAN
jgi:MFS family permease